MAGHFPADRWTRVFRPRFVRAYKSDLAVVFSNQTSKAQKRLPQGFAPTRQPSQNTGRQLFKQAFL